jgi:hypothetical protein
MYDAPLHHEAGQQLQRPILLAAPIIGMIEMEPLMERLGSMPDRAEDAYEVRLRKPQSVRHRGDCQSRCSVGTRCPSRGRHVPIHSNCE